MPVMPDVVVLFRMVLRSWNEEERKYLLSLQEIKEIDDLMSEMIHMIETNRFTRCFWDNFDRKFRNLSFLIQILIKTINLAIKCELNKINLGILMSSVCSFI